jgi:hypothetical protein
MPRKYKRPAVVDHAVSAPENNGAVTTLEPQPEFLLNIPNIKELRNALLALREGKNKFASTLSEMEFNKGYFEKVEDTQYRGFSEASKYSRLTTVNKENLEKNFHTALTLFDNADNFLSHIEAQLPPEKGN